MSAVATRSQPDDQAAGLPSLLTSSTRRSAPLDGAKETATGALLAPCTIGKVLEKPGAAPPAAAAAAAPLQSAKQAAATAPAAEPAEPDEGGACRAAGSQRPAKAPAAQDVAFWATAAKALEDKERLEKVAAFLKSHGAAGVNHTVGWLNKRYPMHIAVEQNDAEMVRLLLESDAKRRVYDTGGLTPLQLARTLNTMQGSHAAVLKVFSQSSAARAAAKKHKRTTSTSEKRLPSLKRSATASTSASASTCTSTPGAGAFAGAPTLKDAEAQCSSLGSARGGAAAPSPAAAAAALQRAFEEERSLRLAAESELQALREQVKRLEEVIAKAGGI